MKNVIDSKSRFLMIAAIMIAILSVSNSCTKSTAYNAPAAGGTGSKGATGPGANEVWIQGMAFTPASITVVAGTTIKWTNKDAVAHTVTSNTNLFNSGSIANGGVFTFTFATAGTYDYYCAIHPSMTATVTAQ